MLQIRRIGNRLLRFGKKSDASGTIFLKAIQIVTSVIANPQGEAIQRTRMDCFTAFAKTENVTVIIIIGAQPEAISAFRIASCFVSRSSQRRNEAFWTASVTRKKGAIQIVAKRRSCVVIGKNTVHFSGAERDNGDSCSLSAAPSSATFSVIANAVKQSIQVHWIASPCGFAMTGVTI
jgi:hypothetical protein